MKWLKENNCPWNEETFEYAAKNGNLENMKWLLENNCPWDIHFSMHIYDMQQKLWKFKYEKYEMVKRK